jgi:ketosteroid isomerase-like protein
MAEEYVERLRRGYSAFSAGGVEAILDQVAPQLEISDRQSAPDRETFVGGEGIVELVRLNMEAFDQLELEAKEFMDAGEVVLVSVRMQVRGRTSGVPLDTETCHAWQFNEGKAQRMQIYASKQRAIEALGLDVSA